jgi:hypothetical protein
LYHPSVHGQNGLTLLNAVWKEVIEADTPDAGDADLGSIIDAVLSGKEVGYKKAIIIQLAGKASDFSLDA